MFKKDDIYSTRHDLLNHFTFDEQVADVFADMINRSVPGYRTIINTIPEILREYLTADSIIYDIGCSLGAASLMLAKAYQSIGIKIEAIDYSHAMVEKAKRNVQSYKFSDIIKVLQADILEQPLLPCDAVIMNFTLQFIAPEKRSDVIQKIANALPSGQVFILSEKIKFTDDVMNNKITELHYEFKRSNGYTDLEISQKRSALEEVMIIDDMNTHKTRLTHAGFSTCDVWFQHLNFASFIAIK
ncbi:MAG: carboxy-S-adenosyl-L-methionine synthase CmoA [Pseudomonadota bacterium]